MVVAAEAWLDRYSVDSHRPVVVTRAGTVAVAAALEANLHRSWRRICSQAVVSRALSRKTITAARVLRTRGHLV